MILTLLRQRNQAVVNNRYLESASRDIAIKLRLAISRSKHLSRLVGYRQGVKELQSVDPDYKYRTVSFVDSLVGDFVDARRYANNFAVYWLTKANEYLKQGFTYAKSARAANRDTLYRLELIAATESSEAFTEGKNAAGREYDGFLILFKVWDASMDKHSCSVCDSSDGEMVSIEEKFSYGEPGSVHPNCRCTYNILSANELTT